MNFNNILFNGRTLVLTEMSSSIHGTTTDYAQWKWKNTKQTDGLRWWVKKLTCCLSVITRMFCYVVATVLRRSPRLVTDIFAYRQRWPNIWQKFESLLFNSTCERTASLNRQKRRESNMLQKRPGFAKKKLSIIVARFTFI